MESNKEGQGILAWVADLPHIQGILIGISLLLFLIFVLCKPLDYVSEPRLPKLLSLPVHLVHCIGENIGKLRKLFDFDELKAGTISPQKIEGKGFKESSAQHSASSSPNEIAIKDDEESFDKHAAAVFLELFLVLILVEIVWRKHERQLGDRNRRSQLKFIKSVMFRDRLQGVFLADFDALREGHEISLRGIKNASTEKLDEWRKQIKKWQEELKLPSKCKSEDSSQKKSRADQIEKLYKDDPNHTRMNLVLKEYGDAKLAWEEFKNFALRNNFDDVFGDMIQIQHLISDVSACQETKSCMERHLERILHVWSNGIIKFIDYAIELKRESDFTDHMSGEAFFQQMMDEYINADDRKRGKEGRERRVKERRVKEREATKDNVAAVAGEIFQAEVSHQTRIIDQ